MLSPTLQAIERERGREDELKAQTVQIKLDGRLLRQAIVRYTLNEAARRPSTFTGGSLVTGA